MSTATTATAAAANNAFPWDHDGDDGSDRWPEPVPTRVVQERRRAQDPATPVQELRAAMLISDDPGVRRAVLANSACRDWIRFAAASDDPDPDVRAAAVRTAIDASPVRRWALDPAWQVRAEVASRPDTDPALLADLAQADPDGLVRRSALCNPACPSEALLAALTGTRRLDAETAADSPALDLIGLVDHLDRIESTGVRAVIAARVDAPAALLGLLGTTDPDPGIRVTAVSRPDFPAALLSGVLDDRSAKVRLTAVSHSRLPGEALRRAVDNPDPAVRCHAAAHPATDPVVLGRLAVSDPVKTVRRSACDNPTCPPDALAVAAVTDRHATVRTAAAGNPGCPSHVVDAACTDADHKVRLAAIGNPAVTATGAFDSLTLRSGIRRAAGAADAPPSTRRRGPARTNAEVTEAARSVLANTPWQRLRQLPLQRLTGPDLRVALAPHLTEAAGHDSAKVRAAVAAHPDVPAATLTALAGDPSPTVRRAASTRLLRALTTRTA